MPHLGICCSLLCSSYLHKKKFHKILERLLTLSKVYQECIFSVRLHVRIDNKYLRCSCLLSLATNLCWEVWQASLILWHRANALRRLWSHSCTSIVSFQETNLCYLAPLLAASSLRSLRLLSIWLANASSASAGTSNTRYWRLLPLHRLWWCVHAATSLVRWLTLDEFWWLASVPWC